MAPRKSPFNRVRRILDKAEAISAATQGELVTKSDLKEAVADLEVDILRWLVVTQLALGGFIFAALKFLR